MGFGRSLSGEGLDASQAAAPARGGSGDAGLALFKAVLSRALPRYLIGDVIEPTRTIGAAADTSLKVSFWHSTVEGAPQESDPAFLSLSLRTSRSKAWRDASPSGVISMLPFEGAQWRFERPVSFVQFHLPFPVVRMVCDALFDRDLAHSDFNMSADVLDARLRGFLHTLQDTACWIEPTNLLLDSWALILCETLLRRLSTHGGRPANARHGKIDGRGIARVVDYIEAGIDQDLRLTSLAEVAAMSVYHFARCFKDTVGLSPHAYVLSRRVTRAHALLSRSEDSLSHVALACGFSSQAHFTTVFHRSLGVTPGGFRRSLL